MTINYGWIYLDLKDTNMNDLIPVSERTMNIIIGIAITALVGIGCCIGLWVAVFLCRSKKIL
jgi:hypothetical protein